MVKLKIILRERFYHFFYGGGTVFGFVVANPEKLTEAQRIRYKAVYCGLCEDLGKDRGFKCRMTLTYDLVFLAIVLSAVSGEYYTETSGRCPVYPSKKRKYLRNKYTSYAADMNIALAYYKYLDDWQDDKSVDAFAKSLLFKKEVERISKCYPKQCEGIKKCLAELAQVEKNGILVPDIPSDIFGRLLGSIFAHEDFTEQQKLYDFGFALGKFIYVIDAVVDLKSDIRKKKYNPFVCYSFNDIEPVLRMIMADCVEKYNALSIKQDKEIIENILFSGVWTGYDSRKKGNKK